MAFAAFAHVFHRNPLLFLLLRVLSFSISTGVKAGFWEEKLSKAKAAPKAQAKAYPYPGGKGGQWGWAPGEDRLLG